MIPRPAPPAGNDESNSVARYLIFFSLAIGGCALDLWTKQAVFDWRGPPGHKPTYWIIDGYFGIETAVNIGAVFGIGAGRGPLFALLSVVAAIGIFLWLFRFRASKSLWLTVALGCVMGGIFGNLYDRLGFWYEPWMDPRWKSGVRDWILWQASNEWRWPNFNIADSLLVIGAVMLVWHSLFLVPEEDTQPQTPASGQPTGPKETT